MHSPSLAIRTVLWNSLRVLGAALPALTAIAACTAAALILIAGSVIAINWGVSLEGASIDPRVLSLTVNGQQFAVIGAGLLVALIPLSYAIGAIVHVAADPSAGLRTAIGRIQAKGLQLFWLQWLVNILAARYSPYAAILMWLATAAALPVAILENLGPVEAIERQHSLAAGNRIRVYALVLLLTFVALLLPAVLGTAVFGAGPTGLEMAPMLRLVLGIPTLAVVLVPTELLLIALTLIYREQSGRTALHARGAANVNS